MIQALRQRHRWMTGGMAIIAASGLITGLVSRPLMPTMADLPAPLVQQTRPSVQPALRSGAGLWTGASVETTIFPEEVMLTTIEPLRRPDPLLYYSPNEAAVDAPLPANARLLGAIIDGPDQRFALPANEGWLYIFSLAHGQIVARLALGGT
ncbi:MAG: hypothetical protein AAFV53_10800 [Myxococcota bacterium]